VRGAGLLERVFHLPELQLAADLVQAGTKAALALRVRVINGEYDAGVEESEEWANSEEGQEVFGKLVRKR
jgi:hypothetical protein